jgi:hypothetical protein
MQWLLLTDLPSQNKDSMTFTPDLVASMLGETRQFTTSVFGPQGDGTLATLLTSSNTFIDARLASLYGVPAPSGTGFSPVTLDSHQRAGILTQASYLAMRSNPDKQNPVNVGVSILRRLMCNDIQKPTNVFIPTLPPQQPNETIRQWYSQHATQTLCNSCHSTIDAIGFAFLNYDAIGTWMTTDVGQPVDASGSFTAPGGSTAFMYNNAIDLVSELAKAPEVSDCTTAMWVRYLNRRIEAAGDTVSLQTARGALAAHSNDMREMLVALSTTNAFTTRLPNPGENIQ